MYQKDKSAYISEEFHVPVGRYPAQLNIDLIDHKVEPLDIRFYTFEADIFLTEGKLHTNIFYIFEADVFLTEGKLTWLSTKWSHATILHIRLICG